MLRQGGWPMIPLAICSVAGLAIVLERIVALRRHRVIDPRVLGVLRDYQGEESSEGALRICQRAHGAFARIVEEVIRVRHLDHAQSIESMHAAGRAQIGRLDRGLTLLEIIASISPLIGLLGTVLGLVTVFEAITSQGLGNPQILSDGIRKALITTVAGLCVAIPAVACHSILSKRVESLAAEMQELATGFIVKLQGFADRERTLHP